MKHQQLTNNYSNKSFWIITLLKLWYGWLWLLGFYVKQPKTRVQLHFYKIVIVWLILMINLILFAVVSSKIGDLDQQLQQLNNDQVNQVWSQMVSNNHWSWNDLMPFVTHQTPYLHTIQPLVNNDDHLLTAYLDAVIYCWVIIGLFIFLTFVVFFSWWSVIGLGLLKWTRKRHQKWWMIVELLFSPLGPIYSYYHVLLYGVRYQVRVAPLTDISWTHQIWLLWKRWQLKLDTWFHKVTSHKEIGFVFPQNGYDPDQFLVVKNLNFSYDHHRHWWWKLFTDYQQQLTLKNINLNIKKGSFVTILGANGSGKSTLIKTLINQHQHYTGVIKWGNENLKNINLKSFSQNVAVISQGYNFSYATKVYDFVAFGRSPYLNIMSTLGPEDHLIIQQAMAEVEITHLADKLVSELSGGQKQKLLIAIALAQQTDTIILDEPTTFLDIKNQYELLEMLKKLHLQNKTIIAVLHDLNHAIQYSEELILMKDGMIYAQGHPDQVINKENLKAVFNFNGQLVHFQNRTYLANIVS